MSRHFIIDDQPDPLYGQICALALKRSTTIDELWRFLRTSGVKVGRSSCHRWMCILREKQIDPREAASTLR